MRLLITKWTFKSDMSKHVRMPNKSGHFWLLDKLIFECLIHPLNEKIYIFMTVYRPKGLYFLICTLVESFALTYWCPKTTNCLNVLIRNLIIIYFINCTKSQSQTHIHAYIDTSIFTITILLKTHTHPHTLADTHSHSYPANAYSQLFT